MLCLKSCSLPSDKVRLRKILVVSPLLLLLYTMVDAVSIGGFKFHSQHTGRTSKRVWKTFTISVVSLFVDQQENEDLDHCGDIHPVLLSHFCWWTATHIIEGNR